MAKFRNRDRTTITLPRYQMRWLRQRVAKEQKAGNPFVNMSSEIEIALGHYMISLLPAKERAKLDEITGVEDGIV